jgi:predicted alpha-1,2-mannosidase
MVGNNSASVVAEAYLKGIRGNYNPEDLWEAVTFGAHNVHPNVSSTGRLGHEYYDSLGYVSCDVGIKESAARTLEYAYEDWCIWQFGKALGKSEEELAHYKKASENYKNLFFDKYCLMAGRRLDGTFAEPFSPLKWGGDFTEGNSLHYTWSVFHNPDGLKELMGGEERFIEMLDSVFNIPPLFDDSYYGHTIHEIREMQTMNMGNYAHGNQPVQHMIYLYDWTSQPWKAQMRVREVMDRLYSATPDGYCGDEDNGQTSAWYVFSALGFYPVCPTSTEYALGTPLFRKATVHLPGGNLVVRAGVKGSCRASAGDSDKIARTPYVDNFRINGRRVTRNYLRHNELTGGARLDFTLSDSPNLSRGTKPEDLPYSYSNN